MANRPWAMIDEDWWAKEERAIEQRAANVAAVREGRPLPHPNFFAVHDPTKLVAGAREEAVIDRVRAFRRQCRPFQAKRHTI